MRMSNLGSHESGRLSDYYPASNSFRARRALYQQQSTFRQNVDQNGQIEVTGTADCRRINTSDYGHTVFVREHHKTENNGSKEIGNTLLF